MPISMFTRHTQKFCHSGQNLTFKMHVNSLTEIELLKTRLTHPVNASGD